MDRRFRWWLDQGLAQQGEIREGEKAKGHQVPSQRHLLHKLPQLPQLPQATGEDRQGVQVSLLQQMSWQLKFSEEIAHAKLQPAIVLWSGTTKQMALLVLTVPREGSIEPIYGSHFGEHWEFLGSENQPTRNW